VTVFLVGAGPGDPGLITVRGLDLVRRADVLVLDRLAGDQLPLEAKPGCVLINAGKAPGDGSRYLDDILIAQTVGGFGDRGVLLRTEDDLGHAFAVAQVDEDDAAVVAA
jgi:siroheme synthase